jgi:deazaflavin-dependent oxidoreductase (nitroreductase family)
VGERKHNPFTGSPTGGRILSASQLPIFLLRPPHSYGVLTTRGRKTGKRRRRCVRAVRAGDRAYVVAIKGRTGWLRNIEANPEVQLRLRGGTFAGTARKIGDEEWAEAKGRYCGTKPRLFERLEYRNWRTDRPTPERIRALHETWFDTGTPLVVELTGPR